jgi:sortase A
VRRVAGLLLAGIGGVLLVYTAGTYAVGAYQREALRQQWTDALARAEVVQARRSAEGAMAQPSSAGAPVARLVIPRIALDEIVLEGVGKSELNAGPGHLPGSAVPGNLGNAIISAHRDRHFDRLGELVVGDTIATETLDGWRHWVVVSRKVIDRERPALFHTPSATLTLTTCWPIRYFGTAPERLVLTAQPAGAAPARIADASFR